MVEGVGTPRRGPSCRRSAIRSALLYSAPSSSSSTPVNMDDLLADGDFDDFAAAVGEGGDGSDDDARVRWTGTHNFRTFDHSRFLHKTRVWYLATAVKYHIHI